MQRRVGEHIQELEKKRDLLSGQIMEESNRTKRNKLETSCERWNQLSGTLVSQWRLSSTLRLRELVKKGRGQFYAGL